MQVKGEGKKERKQIPPAAWILIKRPSLDGEGTGTSTRI
jgi:hypothetical protein